MTDPINPADSAALLAAIDRELDRIAGARASALDGIVELDAERAALGYHPNYPAYVMGGMLAEKKFGAGHILAVIGFHLLDWRDALDRLARALIDTADDPACLLLRLRSACEADGMLDAAGFAWCQEADLLKRSAIDGFWNKRPRFGLGQTAKAFGLKPERAAAHRGLYALPVAALRRKFETVAGGQTDQRFGAMLVPVIEAGGEGLARFGAEALHRDAERRYRDDCDRFAEHQAATPDRRWRWKPALSRQGHLAVTTARAKDVAIPNERTRGRAANWLSDHDANIRFIKDDEA